MNLPEPFVWEQRDTNDVRCKKCDEVVKATTIDIHIVREHPELLKED